MSIGGVGEEAKTFTTCRSSILPAGILFIVVVFPETSVILTSPVVPKYKE